MLFLKKLNAWEFSFHFRMPFLSHQQNCVSKNIRNVPGNKKCTTITFKSENCWWETSDYTNCSVVKFALQPAVKPFDEANCNWKKFRCNWRKDETRTFPCYNCVEKCVEIVERIEEMLPVNFRTFDKLSDPLQNLIIWNE